MKQYYVYIVASKKDGVLYIGMTSDLIGRNYQHKSRETQGFTEKYWAQRLVYYEIHHDPREAITREKQLKKWNRAWKVELIEKANPEWRDLYYELAQG